MRRVFPWPGCGSFAVILSFAVPLCAQQGPDAFRWVDFHSEKDRDTIVWVTRSLEPEKWTAIREIGVEYDAALVLTTLRSSPQSAANADTFTLWTASLTTHAVAPLLKGVNLRWLDWLHFRESEPAEPAILYDNCTECSADTYFTAFHYDPPQHMWTARWLRGGQGVQVWSANPPRGVTWTQIYAILSDYNGQQFLGTWSHYDYGKVKPPEDFVYRYDIEPFSGLERVQVQSAKEGEAMKLRLCNAPVAVPGMSRGQDSPLCQQLIKPRVERRPVTTPPGNNHGRSQPPSARH